MQTTDIKEILNIRENNIAKLNNYLNAGKTIQEKIVSNLIKKIQKSDVDLEKLGYTNFEHINDDGSFTKTEVTPQLEKQSTLIPDHKPNGGITKAVKTVMGKLGATVRLDLRSRLEKLGAKLNRKPNNLVSLMLDDLYDTKTKKFKIKINKKEATKITSYHLKQEHINAIEKLSKETGYNKSEIFNILLEACLDSEEQRH
ncbi:hypothetical protein P5F48_14490 [Clostridium perfringens]|nr:hypothetical protein [Clostridium perfringens]